VSASYVHEQAALIVLSSSPQHTMASRQHLRLNKGYGFAVLVHLLINGPTLAMAQAPAPVFTMKSNTHFPTPATDATLGLGANDVDIQESNGIDVTFGTEWSKRISEAVKTNCAGAPSSQCQDQVKQVLGLGTTKGGLQARLIPLLLLAGAATANVIAAIIMMSGSEQPAEVLRVHITQDQNVEMYVQPSTNDSSSAC